MSAPGNSLSNERFHGLDAARGIALLIGIVHHGIESLVTYVNGDWVTQDSQSSLFLDIIFYISHVFRMQAFFLMSGFFAHLLFHRKGVREFALNRLKRLVLPFILFWPLLYFFIYHLWVWGIQFNQHISYGEAVAKIPGYMIWSNGFPLMHLWFLYFLILFCACVVLVRPVIEKWIDPNNKLRHAVDRILSFVITHWWGALALGIVMVAPMVAMTDWFGVDTSSSGLLPRPAPFIIYGLYFTLGWFLHRSPSLIESIGKFRVVNLLISLILIALVIILSLLFSEPADPADGRMILAGLNTIYAFASITAVFAFIGYMITLFNKPHSTIRYISDSAYWGYLIHLPIVAFLQILVATSAWYWAIKVAMILTVTLSIIAVTYHYAVRSTWLGVLLNGKKQSQA